MGEQADQHEATIAAALALPEAERYRLWQLLDEQFLPYVDRNFAVLKKRGRTYAHFIHAINSHE